MREVLKSDCSREILKFRLESVMLLRIGKAVLIEAFHEDEKWGWIKVLLRNVSLNT